MSRSLSFVSGKPYGLASVCRVWRLARSGIYRPVAAAPTPRQARRGPTGAMSDDALTAAIRGVLAASPFHGEGHRKVWARLRHAGIRTSLRRVLRLMRENDLLAPGRAARHVDRATRTAPSSPNRGHNVGNRPDTTLHCRGPGRGVRRGRSLLRECVGIHAHSRAPASRRSSQSARACADTSAGLRRTSPAASRCATTMDRNTCRTFPEGDRVPRHRSSPAFVRAPRERLRRAVHPDAQGKPPLGPHLRDDRGTAPSLCWCSARPTTRPG